MAIINDYRITDDHGEVSHVTARTALDDDENTFIVVEQDGVEISMTKPMAAELIQALGRLGE